MIFILHTVLTLLFVTSTTPSLHGANLEAEPKVKQCIGLYEKQTGETCSCIDGYIRNYQEDLCVKEAYITIVTPENELLINNVPNSFSINGSLSNNCNKVTVAYYNYNKLEDQYTLEKFNEGNTSFQYNIKESLKNISNGKNKYLVTAYCDGPQTVTDSIVISYYPAVTDLAIEKNFGFSDEDYSLEAEKDTPKQPQPIILKNKTTQCDKNYSGGCVPIASDVDCAGGSGNGPAYVRGPVYVIGYDVYGLDRDNDGIGCE